MDSNITIGTIPQCLSSCPTITQSTTLLHELMHVYQHVEGSLKDKHGKRLWKGIDSSELDYDDQPWEKEAHQMEDILYKKYISCNAL